MINLRWLIRITPGSLATMGIDTHAAPVLQMQTPVIVSEYREVNGRGETVTREIASEWTDVPIVYERKE